MAEKEKTETEKKEKPKAEEKKEKPKAEEKKERAEAERKEQKQREEYLIRIASTDIPGSTSIYSGLTRIKGISWMISSAVCKLLNLDKRRKILTLSEKEISQIESFIKNIKLPSWLVNRRADSETGVDRHLITADLDLQREFDVRKMKKIRSYKGVRHILGQPVRGQRTRAHFRKGRAIGVKRLKAAQPAAQK